MLVGSKLEKLEVRKENRQTLIYKWDGIHQT